MSKKFTPSEAARLLSSRGASNGGKARAAKLSPDRRKEIARQGGNARWQKGKIKFLVTPGFVHSKNDGDEHFIHAHVLMRLYRVDPRECLTITEEVLFEWKSRGLPPPGYSSEYLNSLIVLAPRYDGDYSQFWI